MFETIAALQRNQKGPPSLIMITRCDKLILLRICCSEGGIIIDFHKLESLSRH